MLARSAAVAALSFVGALLVLVVAFGGGAAACATSDPPDLTKVDNDAGPPVGFAECNAVYFGDYLKACSDFSDCHNLLHCDFDRDFAATARCHAKLCELASECVDAYKGLCLGSDFHFECIRSNPIDPTECRVVAGAAPSP